jgi:LysM repeat protein
MVLAVTRPRRRISRLVALGALAAVIAGVVLIVTSSSGGPATPSRPAKIFATTRKLPPYWIVHPGDTYGLISARTGLTLAQLQAFNPTVDPLSLIPGERLNLWAHPPVPRPPPPGPMFWVVQPGQSFGSIAAKTGINLATLEQLNPKLKPNTLQPGNRVRLRH